MLAVSASFSAESCFSSASVISARGLGAGALFLLTPLPKRLMSYLSFTGGRPNPAVVRRLNVIGQTTPITANVEPIQTMLQYSGTFHHAKL